ncbi:MAG: hypothetical protein ABI303_03690 [Candidatus Saccharimonas sp.]
MGMFRKYKKDDGSVNIDKVEQFLDENFREELRNHGRWYFERVINENGSLFKKDLDATIEQINSQLSEHVQTQLEEAIVKLNAELKDHVTNQLKSQFDVFTQDMRVAQDATLQLITHSAQDLQRQHEELSKTVQTGISEQGSLLHTAYEENKSRIAAMSDAQEQALQSIKAGAIAIQGQYQMLSDTLKREVDEQKALLVNRFEKNMAQIVERYLLDALGDEYDLKSQLPRIIKRLEENKQAIVDDVQL